MDKLELVKIEIEKIKSEYPSSAKTLHFELNNVLDFIDSMQEEPVSIDFEQELYKAFGQVKDFTLGMRIAKWFYDMGKTTNLMTEKATDAVVHIDAGGYPYIPQLELYDYDKDVPLAKEGDKYKVVLIKEE